MAGLLDQLFSGAGQGGGGGLLDLTMDEKIAAFGMGGPKGVMQAMQMKQQQAMQQMQMQGMLATQQKAAQEQAEKAAQSKAMFGRNIEWQNSADPAKYPTGWDHTGGLLQGASPQEGLLARGMGAPKAAEFFGERMFPKQEPYTLSPGQVRYGPGGKPIAAVPELDPEKIRTLRAAGIDPNDPRVRDKIVEGLGQAKTEVNLDQRTEGAEAKEVGKFFGEQFATLQKGAMNAPVNIAKLDRLDQLLDQVKTGKFAGTTLQFKQAAKAAGIDLESIGIRDDVAPAEAAQALANEMALELRNPSGGAGMPGAMSDADRQFLVSMTPGLEQTPEGRKLIIQARKKIYQRDQDVARLARDYRAKNKTIDEGFFNELQAFAQANPLFSDAAMSGAEQSRLAAPKTESDYAKLPSGARYTRPGDPPGTVRVKP